MPAELTRHSLRSLAPRSSNEMAQHTTTTYDRMHATKYMRCIPEYSATSAALSNYSKGVDGKVSIKALLSAPASKCTASHEVQTVRGARCACC
eukprot:830818-Pleurochrysis_carterae.AAC.1